MSTLGFATLHRWRRSSFGHWREAARRAVALALTLVVIAAVLVSGRVYFWCVPAQRALASCCCADETDVLAEEEAPRPQIERPCCCEPRNAGELPHTTRVAAASALPPGLNADSILPVPSETERPARPHPEDVPAGSEVFATARAGPLLASDRCVILQVWHC